MKKVEFSPSTFQFEIFRLTKAMTKQEGPKVCCDALCLHFFFDSKFRKTCKNRASREKICLFLFCKSFRES